MRFHKLALIPLFCFALAACDTNKKAPPPSATGTGAQRAPGGMAGLPPGHPPIGNLPEGHPALGEGGAPMGGGMGGGGMGGGGMGGAMGGSAPAGPKPLAWTVPEGWKETPPSSSMRVAQFEVGRSGDMSVECKVFGGILGGVDANIQRWVGQFKNPTEPKIEKLETNGLTVTTLDVSGAFGGMSGTEGGPETWRMLAAVVDGAATPIQVQLVGPAAIVEEQSAAFHDFVKSLAPPK